MDKAQLVAQLTEKLKALVDQARKFTDEVKGEAKTGASRAVNLHRATSMRVEAAHAAWEAVASFHPRPLQKGAPSGSGRSSRSKTARAARRSSSLRRAPARSSPGREATAFFTW